MTRPPTLEEAEERGLLTAVKGTDVHTFSNGSEWDDWSSSNCHRCKFFDPDKAGALCAFEAAAFLHLVTPELASLFGWTQDAQYDKPDDHRDGWDAPDSCRFFASRDERNDDERNDDDETPPPVPSDPAQLNLLADPTEDAALFASAPVRDLEFA